MLARLPWTPAKVAEPPPLKINTARRLALVRALTRILAKGEPTKFEFEGACRHGVRARLCLLGWPWPQADDLAVLVVTQALAALAAERPTWLQGQPEYVTQQDFLRLRDSCERCGAPIEQHEFRARRFCSALCADAARQAKLYKIHSKEKAAQRRAYWAAAKSATPKQPCAQCGELFHPTPATGSRPQSRYCSVRCRNVAINEARKARGEAWI